MMMGKEQPVVTVVAAHDGDYFLTRRLIAAYASFGWKVGFVGWDREGRVGEYRDISGVAHRCIMHGWGYANRKLLAALPLWTVRLAAHAASLRADLVHAIDFDSGLGVALGLAAGRTPFLYDIQDNFELRHPFPPPLRLAIRNADEWIIRRSAATLVVGEERIVGAMTRYREKIAVIPNCPADVPPPSGMMVDETLLTLAFVGRIAAPRGVRLLLDACRRLPWLRVLMAGLVEGEALAAELSACAQVELHGYLQQEKALQLVHRSDASFAFYDPSTEICRRANGAKWYDAMMAGKCLLVNSEVMSAGWLVDAGIGYASPYHDLEGLVRILTYLYLHRGEMEAAGARARELYSSRFNRAAMDLRLREVVERVVAGRPAREIKGMGEALPYASAFPRLRLKRNFNTRRTDE